MSLSLSNGTAQKELSKRAQGKSVVHVHNSDIQDVTISYPTIDEQTQIGAFFRSLDSLITLHQREGNIAISASQVASHAQKLQLTRNNLFELSDLLLILVYELLHLGQVDFFLFFKSVDVTRNVQIVIVFLDLF